MAPMTSFLCKNIANPPCTIDAPGLLRVVVKQRIRAHLIDKRFAIRLDIPLFVCRATHDLCGFAVPYPVHLKPGLRFRQHGMVQLRLFPGFGAVGADLDLRYLAMAAPGQTRDAIISGPDLHRSGGLCDDGIRLHPELELHGLAVRKELRVAVRFPPRHPGLVAEFQAAEPFDIQIAFEARHDETDRKAVGRPQRLAVLAVCDEGLVRNLLGERNTPINAGCVGAFRQHPGRSAVLPDEIDEKAKRNAGPLIGAHKTMGILDREIGVRLFFQFSQPLPVHSMKTVRVIEGIRMRSSTVNTSCLLVMPWISKRCFAGSRSGLPEWLRS